MKKRRSIVILLALALVFSMFPATSMAISMDAQNMERMGLLRGVDATRGVDAAYLAMDTQRYQAVVIMARLMGMEQQLLQTDPNGPTFTDAAGTSEFVRRVMAFAKANPELGFVGFPDGSFQPLAPATAQQIYKVLLVAAGFEENRDFTWEQVFYFSSARNMHALRGMNVITNDHLATALAEGLRLRSADGVNTLGTLLVSRGVISQFDAAASGVFGGGGGGPVSLSAVGLGLMTAEADGDATTQSTRIRLTFNQAVNIVARDNITVSGDAVGGSPVRIGGAGNIWDIPLSEVSTGFVTVQVGARWTRTVQVYGPPAGTSVTATTADNGETVTVNLANGTFDATAVTNAANWTIGGTQAGLTVSTITRDSATQVTVAFTGTPSAPGTLTIRPNAAALATGEVPAAASVDIMVDLASAEALSATIAVNSPVGDIVFPTTATVNNTGGGTATVTIPPSVVWVDVNGFIGTTVGDTYVFTATITLPAGWTNTSNLEVEATVTVEVIL